LIKNSRDNGAPGIGRLKSAMEEIEKVTVGCNEKKREIEQIQNVRKLAKDIGNVSLA
jgi:hypothetical protein